MDIKGFNWPSNPQESCRLIRSSVHRVRRSLSNASVDFETYLLQCLRSSPVDLEWQRHLLYVTIGLISESTELVDFMGHCRDVNDPFNRRQLVQRVERFEFYRALAYYRLDLRPTASHPPVRRPAFALEAAIGLAVNAGRAAGLVNEWMFHRHSLDEHIRFTMNRLDAYRRVFYELVALDPEQVWANPDSRQHTTSTSRKLPRQADSSQGD